MRISVSDLRGRDIIVQQIENQYVPPTSEISIPVNLPTRPEHFTGRESELAQVLEQLQPGQVVTLCGTGGIGKTAIVAEAVWRLYDNNSLLERFPDGVLYYSFYEQPDTAVALEYITRSFPDFSRISTLREATRRALSSKTALLILDGTEAATDINQLLDIRGNSGVLVTSQRRRDALGAWIDVRPLLDVEAVELFLNLTRNRINQGELVSTICNLVGHLPLAVRLAARYVIQSDLEADEYLDWLRLSPLGALDQGSRRVESVPLLLAYSISKLSADAQTVVKIIGELSITQFDLETITFVLGIGTDGVLRALGELVDYGLIMRVGPSYQVVHRLIHVYARERLVISADFHSRLMQFFAICFSEQVKDATTLESYKSHAVELMIRGAQRELWQGMENLIGPLENYLEPHGHYGELLQVIKAQLDAYTALEIYPGQGDAYTRLGIISRILGNLEKSLDFHRQALPIRVATGDRHGELHIMGNIANVYLDMGNPIEALIYDERALEISRELGDRLSEGGTLNNLGSVYLYQEKYEEAVNYCSAALAIAQEFGNEELECQSLGNLSAAYGFLGKIEYAIACARKTLLISKKRGHRRTEAMALNTLGLLHSEAAELDKAVEYTTQGIIISCAIGDRRTESSSRQNLANVYVAQGKLTTAESEYKKVVEISQDIGDRQTQLRALIGLRRLYGDMKQWSDMIKFCLQELDIVQQLGDLRGEAIVCNVLGSAYAIIRHPSQAIDYFSQGLTANRSLNDNEGVLISLVLLGKIHLEFREDQRAADCFLEAMDLCEVLEDKIKRVDIIENLGVAHANMGQMAQAIIHWMTAAASYRDMGDHKNEAKIRSWLGEAYAYSGNYEATKEQFDVALSIANAINDPELQSNILSSIRSAHRHSKS